jgi:hypothetical protein
MILRSRIKACQDPHVRDTLLGFVKGSLLAACFVFAWDMWTNVQNASAQEFLRHLCEAPFFFVLFFPALWMLAWLPMGLIWLIVAQCRAQRPVRLRGCSIHGGDVVVAEINSRRRCATGRLAMCVVIGFGALNCAAWTGATTRIVQPIRRSAQPPTSGVRNVTFYTTFVNKTE